MSGKVAGEHPGFTIIFPGARTQHFNQESSDESNWQQTKKQGTHSGACAFVCPIWR
jgi:hypothetical protein